MKNNFPENDFKRPLQPQRVVYTQAWLYFLLIICMVVAWWLPARMLVQHYIYSRTEPPPLRDSYAFAALAYAGISDMTNEVSPALFKEHLTALRRAGYASISLDDARDLVLKGKPLPPKAVLMTFDHSRKSSYFEVRSFLRRANWKAVMFLWTKPIIDKDPSALYWPYVRSMLRSRFWELGAQSHNGFTEVLSDASGGKGNYLTTPMWLPDKSSYEDLKEFRKRIVKDHAECLKLIEDNAGSKPMAYAYPYGDYGQFNERSVMARRLNLDCVGTYYDLGFVTGNFVMNTRFSDRRCLNRLLVKPEWSGEELVAFLAQAWPDNQRSPSRAEMTSPVSWIVDWGKAHITTNSIRLFAPPQTTGAKMWLAGSDLYRDFSLKIDFRVGNGQLGVFLRASPNEEGYLYFGIDQQGAWVHQKHAGSEPITLASAPRHNDLRRINELEIHLRGRVCFVKLNGRQLFDELITMHTATKPGMLALSVWDPNKGIARAEVTELSVFLQKPTVAEWLSRGNNWPYLAQWLSQNAYRLSYLSPPWISASRGGLEREETWDDKPFAMLANIYALELMPTLSIGNPYWPGQVSPSNIIKKASALQADGILINLAELDHLAIPKITPWLQELGFAMQKTGLKFLVKLPQFFEKMSVLPSALAAIPNLQVAAVSNAPLFTQDTKPTNTAIVAESVPLPPDNLDLPHYYEIIGLEGKVDRLAPEVRGELLRQEGFRAFQAGNYPGALAAWEKWHNLDPQNENALMLMGDACWSMHDVARTIDYYGRSLAINPGQIELAIRRARLVDESGKAEEARDILNLYARVFPGNVHVTLAQAEWLNRHKREQEAQELINKVLELYPNDLSAIAFLHDILVKPAERYANMRRLLAIGSQPVLQYELGEVIYHHDLMARPELCVMNDFIEQIMRLNADPQLTQIYGRLRPLNGTVTENFSRASLSSEWIVFGESAEDYRGQYRLKAHKGLTEASLRLIGSDTMHNGFIEAGLTDVKGYFWLYACRQKNNMLRFGFDEKNYIYLQVWRKGELAVNEVRVRQLPSRMAKLRLEKRGDGIAGLIDGIPAFHASVPVPFDFGFGWWGLAPFSPRPGVTYATLTMLRAGPLPVQMAIIPSRLDEKTILEMLTPYVGLISAVCPLWFDQAENGEIKKLSGEEETIVRMLARYNRLRLLPVIAVAEETELNGLTLANLAVKNNVYGFVLLLRSLPAEEWFARLAQELEHYPLDITALVIDEDRNIVQVGAINLGIGLFAGAQKTRWLHLLKPTKEQIEEGEVQEAVGDCIISFSK